jgi:hypothetical protein
MADITTQKINQTINWTDFVANSNTLFTTDANTRYVIKDVELANNSFPGSFGLVINDTQVAAVGGSITGTEIIDVNSTVRLTYDTSIANYISVNYISNSGQLYSNNVTAGAVFYTPTGFVSNAATSSTSTSMTQLTNSGNIQGAWLLNGNFYYMYNDGNSQQALYRRAGGITGTESIIYGISSYSPCCFDGVSKFYWINSSGQLYDYDTVTGSSNYRGGFPAGSTYPFLNFVGGYVFYSPSYTGYNQIYWYRVSNGGTGSFGTDSSVYSSNNGTVGFFNPSTNAIRIVVGSMTGFGSSYAYYDISVASGTPTYVGYATGRNSQLGFRYNTFTGINNNVAIMLGSNASSSTIYLVDNAMAVISQKTITGANFSNSGQSGSFQIINPTTEVKNVTSPSVRMRITGVQTV